MSHAFIEPNDLQQRLYKKAERSLMLHETQ
jgi:hypothetical protein